MNKANLGHRALYFPVSLETRLKLSESIDEEVGNNNCGIRGFGNSQ
jgi:hypothetical protein